MQIAQDANIYVSEISANQQAKFHNKAGRQSYVLCLEGEVFANKIGLRENDALKLWGEENINFSAHDYSQLLIVEVAEG